MVAHGGTSGDYIPDRGDIIWLNFTPQAGHEQAGHRPALVLSPKSYNEKTGMAVCCPITSRIRDYPFHVRLPAEGAITGVLMVDQIKSLDWQARGVRFECHCPAEVIEEVLHIVNLILN